MFREHAKLFNTLQFTSDLLLTIAAFPLAYFTRAHIDGLLPPSLERLLNPILHPIERYFFWVALSIGWWAISAYFLGLYRIGMRRSSWEKVRILLESSILLGLFFGFLSFALKLDVSRFLIGLYMVFQAGLLSFPRLALALHTRYRRRPSRNQRNILIVGTSAKARDMGRLVARYSDWGLRILGYVELTSSGNHHDAPDVLGNISSIPQIIEDHVVDEIIFVGTEPRDLEGLDEVLAICKEQGVRTRVAVDFFPVKVAKVSMEFLESVPVITFSATPDHAFSLFVKRAMDVILALALLILLVPFLIVIGILVGLTSKGPVIYRQIRCGLYGRKFTLYKFRSMNEGAEDVLWEIRHLNEMDGPVFKMRNDPRVTLFGRFLRKSSLDEFPQLWNVVKGDMSLVGPRSPLPEEVKEYTRWQRRRLSVKPGITCLWQVSGRNEIDFHEWMKLDLQYIDNWSLLLDLKILLRTFPVVLLGKGAR